MKRSLEPAHDTVAPKQAKQTNGDDDDEDEDEDEDYDPTKDKEEQAELLADAVEETRSKKEAGADGASSLYTEIQGVARKRRVDELWESMKSEEATEPVKVSATAAGRKKRRKDTRKAKKILAGIFGSSSVAGNIVAKAKESSQVDRPSKKLSKKAGVKIKASVLQIARMKTVTETAKFAGQTIEVKRQVLSAAPSSSGGASETATKVAESSLDAALSAITGSTKINTVTKSSADWENFKEETGAAGELEQAAKDGFLAKKDFLDRCDVRAFEKERDTRLAKSK